MLQKELQSYLKTECPHCHEFTAQDELIYHLYMGKPICVKKPQNKLNWDFMFGLFFGISVGSLIAWGVFLLI